MITKLQLFKPETVVDIQRKENWVASSFFFQRKQFRMLGKKESKSDGELRRKHWFCKRGNISRSAGAHAPSTTGPLIRHTVYRLAASCSFQNFRRHRRWQYPILQLICQKPRLILHWSHVNSRVPHDVPACKVIDLRTMDHGCFTHFIYNNNGGRVAPAS